MRQNINQMLDPQKTPHTSPLRANYGMYLWLIVRKLTALKRQALYETPYMRF